jgi:type II secretory pathway pseudopilin PulG
MQDLSVPVWAVIVVVACLLLLVAWALVATTRVRRRVTRQLAAAHAEAEALRVQVEEIQRRLTEPPTVRNESEFVITRLGEEAAPSEPVPALPAPLFADMVLRESVVQAAALAAGLRRALSPESRNRIRFEMRREVKRARKQRRADLRAARREWEDRQRARVDLDEDEPEGSAA